MSFLKVIKQHGEAIKELQEVTRKLHERVSLIEQPTTQPNEVIYLDELHEEKLAAERAKKSERT